MHKTIAKGIDNRDYRNQTYHTWLTQQIHTIFRDENDNNYSFVILKMIVKTYINYSCIKYAPIDTKLPSNFQ